MQKTLNMNGIERPYLDTSRHLNSRKSNLLTFLWVAGWGIFFSYAIIHFFVVYSTSVNIPVMDEWDSIFGGQGGTLGWSKEYLLGFHSEHRIVTTKILYLINFYLFKTNIRYQIFFNALIYGAIVLTIWKVVGRKIGNSPYFPALLMMTPFISTLPYGNHSWAFQSQFHFCLLSFIGGSYFLFIKDNWFTLIIGLLLWMVAIFSFSSGVPAVAMATLVFILWKITRKEGLSVLKPVCVLFAVAMGIYFWFQGYQRNPGHPAYTMPWNLKYYRYLGEIISHGFGYTRVNPWSAILCSLTVFVSIFSALFSILRHKLKNPQIGLLLGLMAGILAMLGIVTFGRAGFPLVQAKASRYAEFSILLPILSLALITINKKARLLGTIWLSTLVAFGLYNDFYFGAYRKEMLSRQEGRRCMYKLLNTPQLNPGGICPNLFPGDIRGYLNTAKKINASFLAIRSQ